MNGSRAALPARVPVVSQNVEDSGMPRLIVFSQARWSGNDGGRIARYGRSGIRTRSRWAHANTASNNGTTRRGFWQSDLHRLHVSFRRASYAQDHPDEGCGHAAAGSLLKTPDFPLGVSHLILTSPCPALSAGRARAHAVYSQPGASRGAIKPPATYAHRINSFLPTFRYRRNRP